MLFSAHRALAVSILSLSVLLAGCETAPVALKFEAKAWLEEARGAGAATLAPESLAAAEKALQEAEGELARQKARMRWNRAYGRSEALLDSAIRRAQLAGNLARLREAQAIERADGLLRRADEGFEQLGRFLSHVPPRSGIRSDIKKARVSYREAVSLLEEGDPFAAVEAASQANEDLAEATSGFTRLVQQTLDPQRHAHYRRWVADTIEWSRKKKDSAILVDKLRRSLTLVRNGRRVKTYRAELGLNGTFDKLVAGDRATPEGKYHVTEKRGPGQTRWYKALMLNYPNDEDRARFRKAMKRGEIARGARIGSLIEIHGEGGRGGDWTDGCIALTNSEMDDLFKYVSVGTPVTIVGYESDGSVEAVRLSKP